MKTYFIILLMAVFNAEMMAEVVTNQKIDRYTTQQTNDSLKIKYDRIWPLSSTTYRVMKQGKMGIAMQSGSLILPVEFDQIWDLDSENNIKVLLKGKMGLYNLNGKILIPAEYDNIWPFVNGKAKVMQRGKIGYFDQQGKMIIPCEYQQIWNFENGKARILKNGLMGYVTQDGLEIIPPLYQQIWSFNEGVARVLKNGKIGYINDLGTEIIPPIYTQIWEFNNGRAKAIHDGKIVWIDQSGQIIADAFTETDRSEEIVTMHDTESKDIESQRYKEIRLLNNRIEIVKGEMSNNLSILSHRIPKKDKFKGHYFGVDIGFNNFVSSGLDFSLPEGYSYLDLNDGKSVGVSINILQYNIGLNKNKNLGIVTGMGIEFNNYRFDSNNILIKDENGDLSHIESEREVKKNKLTTSFLNIPVLLEYQINIPSVSDHAYFSAGPVFGIKLKSHTKVMYYGSSTKDKKRSDFCLNDFRYGVMARAGYKAINLTASYYLSPLFYTNKGPELYPVSFSLGICLNL